MNFKFYKEYQEYLREIDSCYHVIKSKDVTNFSDKIYFFDRNSVFRNDKDSEKKTQFKYDISHMNYAGSLKYTNYIITKIKNLK